MADGFCLRETMETNHILIVGDVQTGKSMLIRRLMESCSLSRSGFITKVRQDNGMRLTHIYPVHCDPLIPSPYNLVGVSNGISRVGYPEVFDCLGTRYLEAEGSVILMDELGVMEENARLFQEKVLACLDGETPVLAAVKSKRGVPFLEQVKGHPRAAVYHITRENRETLYEALLPLVRQWEEKNK